MRSRFAGGVRKLKTNHGMRYAPKMDPLPGVEQTSQEGRSKEPIRGVNKDTHGMWPYPCSLSLVHVTPLVRRGRR